MIKELRFNKYACFNAAFMLHEMNYDTFLFHDFNIKINQECLSNNNLLKIITSNVSSPILLTHSKLLNTNDHILLIQKNTFNEINGFPNHYWDLMNGYTELIDKLTGGLNIQTNWWETNNSDKIYVLKKPSDITFDFFTKTNFIKNDLYTNNINNWFTQNRINTRYILNDLQIVL